MKLEGWNHIPHGYAAEFDLEHAPRWLRVWFNCPFLDRFAYPVVVRRGFASLSLMPGAQPGAPIADGWRVVAYPDESLTNEEEP